MLYVVGGAAEAASLFLPSACALGTVFLGSRWTP
jgi:hypothetical protein